MFKTSLNLIDALSVGDVIIGRVENSTLFGVFVDTSTGKAGLIPNFEGF